MGYQIPSNIVVGVPREMRIKVNVSIDKSSTINPLPLSHARVRSQCIYRLDVQISLYNKYSECSFDQKKSSNMQ